MAHDMVQEQTMHGVALSQATMDHDHLATPKLLSRVVYVSATFLITDMCT